ncbi:MAG: DUF3592 domain-containing protein [Oscillospiraceae bacterium]|nr:DUF3592 domain-containing protein [Oscillospiraceae bacterium]
MGSGQRFYTGDSIIHRIIFGLFALTFIGIGLFGMISGIREKKAYERSEEHRTVTAVLVSAKQRKDSDDRTYYQCKWEYTVDGESFEYQDQSSMKPKETRELTLFRDAEGRLQVLDNGNTENIVGSIIAIVVGAILAVIGVIVPLIRRKRNRG